MWCCPWGCRPRPRSPTHGPTVLAGTSAPGELGAGVVPVTAVSPEPVPGRCLETLAEGVSDNLGKAALSPARPNSNAPGNCGRRRDRRPREPGPHQAESTLGRPERASGGCCRFPESPRRGHEGPACRGPSGPALRSQGWESRGPAAAPASSAPGRSLCSSHWAMPRPRARLGVQTLPAPWSLSPNFLPASPLHPQEGLCVCETGHLGQGDDGTQC